MSVVCQGYQWNDPKARVSGQLLFVMIQFENCFHVGSLALLFYHIMRTVMTYHIMLSVMRTVLNRPTSESF